MSNCRSFFLPIENPLKDVFRITRCSKIMTSLPQVIYLPYFTGWYSCRVPIYFWRATGAFGWGKLVRKKRTFGTKRQLQGGRDIILILCTYTKQRPNVFIFAKMQSMCTITTCPHVYVVIFSNDITNRIKSHLYKKKIKNKKYIKN